MKNLVKIIGLIALVAVIGSALVACGGASSPKDFKYELTADGKGIKITGYTGKGGSVVIPSTIEKMPVVEIGPYAFRGGSKDNPNNIDKITSITIPNSVEVISDTAFTQMDELTKVTLPNNLKLIPDRAFSNNPKLTSINLPSNLEEIGAFAFHLCGELSKLTIPNSIKEIKYVESRSRETANERNLTILRTIKESDGGSWYDTVQALRPDNDAFWGCQKLPIATRQKIQGWGYEGRF